MKISRENLPAAPSDQSAAQSGESDQPVEFDQPPVANPNLSRRLFLQLTAVVGTENVLKLFLPQAERAKTAQEQLTESFMQYFPLMSEKGLILMTMPETENPGVNQSVAAFQFWTDYFYPLYAESKRLMAESGISNSYFPETQGIVILDLLTPLAVASTEQNFTDDGEVWGVRLTVHYAYAQAFMGEFIHLLQNRTSPLDGNSRLMIEGVSNVLHYNGAVEWVALNYNAQAAGTPEKAVLMPIFDTTNEFFMDLSIDEFNQIMKDFLVELQEIINLANSFLPLYTSQEEFGISQKYPAGLQLLGTYSGESNYFSYHNAIELPALLTSQFMLDHIFTARDTFLLAPLLVQGTDYSLDRYPDSVKNAIAALREHNLLFGSQEWQQLVDTYSQINAVDVALNPVVTARTDSPGIIDRVTLESYLLMIKPDQRVPAYRELRLEDQPTVKLLFTEKDNQGVEQWWEVTLELKRDFPEATLFSYVTIPKSIRMPDLPPRWISTADRPLVLQVIIDQVEEVTMYDVENFQLQGQFPEAAVVQPAGGPADEKSADDELVATLSHDPATPEATPVVTQDEPSATTRARWAELSRQVDAVNERDSDSFGQSGQAVELQEGVDTSVAKAESDQDDDVQVTFPEHIAALPEFKVLQERLDRVLRKPKKQ